MSYLSSDDHINNGYSCSCLQLFLKLRQTILYVPEYISAVMYFIRSGVMSKQNSAWNENYFSPQTPSHFVTISLHVVQRSHFLICLCVDKGGISVSCSLWTKEIEDLWLLFFYCLQVTNEDFLRFFKVTGLEITTKPVLNEFTQRDFNRQVRVINCFV